MHLRKISTKIILSLVLAAFVLGPFSISLSQEKIAITSSSALAQSYNPQNEETLASTYALPSCFNLAEGFSVTGCGGQFLYFVVWTPTYWLAGRAAGFLDFFIFFSIDAGTYRGVPIKDANQLPTSFILEGWKIVRDITNILFIFGLIYIAFSFVLKASIGGADGKKLLIYLIVMALLINFSLFFSRIIVDAGNILARTLYNQIELVGRGNANEDLTGADGIKSVGLMLTSLANPQALLAPNQSGGINFSNKEDNGNIFILTIVGSIIFNIFLIYIFISVSVYFLARIVGLYYSMIFSPFAFVSLALPKANAIPYIGFQSWIGALINYSFMAPLFIFFMYLTIKFLAIGIPINPNVTGGSSLSQIFMSVAIPFALVIGFLVLGRSQAKKMSGKVGEVVASVVTKSITTTAGIAVGGAALAGTTVIGGAAGALSKSGELKNIARNGLKMKVGGREFNFGGKNIARRTLGASERVSRSNFDLRDNKIAQSFGSAVRTGGALTGTAAPSIGGTRFMGGQSYDERYEGRKKKRKEQLERREQRLLLTGNEAGRRDEEAKEHNRALDPNASRQYESAKATAEASFTATSYYKNLNQEDQFLELQNMRREFDENYEQGKEIKGYDNDTGAIDPTQTGDIIGERVADRLREVRFEHLQEQLEQSTYWNNATTTDADRAYLATELRRDFDASYNNGQVLRNVDADGIASDTGSIAVTDRTDVAANWENEERERQQNNLPKASTYRRMQTSAEINSETRSMLAAEQRDAINRTDDFARGSRASASEEYARRTQAELAKDSRNQNLISTLSTQLEDLNDTLGRYYHLQQTFTEDQLINMTPSQLRAALDSVQPDQLKKAKRLLNQPAERDAVRAGMRQLTATVSGKISAIDVEIRAISEAVANSATGTLDADQRRRLNRLNRERSLLSSEQTNLSQNLDQQANLTTRINAARS